MACGFHLSVCVAHGRSRNQKRQASAVQTSNLEIPHTHNLVTIPGITSCLVQRYIELHTYTAQKANHQTIFVMEDDLLQHTYDPHGHGRRPHQRWWRCWGHCSTFCGGRTQNAVRRSGPRTLQGWKRRHRTDDPPSRSKWRTGDNSCLHPQLWWLKSTCVSGHTKNIKINMNTPRHTRSRTTCAPHLWVSHSSTTSVKREVGKL